MEDSLAGSSQDNGVGPETTGSKQILKPCIITSCNLPADMILCSSHLNSPVSDNFEILEGVQIRPSKAPTTRSKKIQLVHALMAMSPKKLMDRDGVKRQRYIKMLTKTLKSNLRNNVEVVELDFVDAGEHSDYYSEEKLGADVHRSSEHFRSFRPKDNTQIIIHKGSSQLIELTFNFWQWLEVSTAWLFEIFLFINLGI